MLADWQQHQAQDTHLLPGCTMMPPQLLLSKSLRLPLACLLVADWQRHQAQGRYVFHGCAAPAAAEVPDKAAATYNRY
jgi:hypothetical protein